MAVPVYSCMCFDEYHTEGREPCMNGCMSMAAYFVLHSPLARPPCNDPRTGTIEVPGEQPDNPSKLFTTEKGKQFVHTLFGGIFSVVKDNKYLSDITKENIFFSPEGDVRLHDVVVLDAGSDHQRRSKARANYHQACRIAKEIFTGEAEQLGGEIPCDINHLFEMVMKDKLTKNIGLYHIHMSLIPIGVGMLAVIKLHDHLMTTIDLQTRDNLFDKLGSFPEFSRDPNNPNDDTPKWVKEVATNTLLLEVYLFEDSVSYIVTTKLIYNKTGVQTRLYNMMPDYQQRQIFRRTEVAVFIDFLRHRTAHRMQSWIFGHLMYTPEASDYACLAKFRLFLAKLQFELWILPTVFPTVNFSGFFGFK